MIWMGGQIHQPISVIGSLLGPVEINRGIVVVQIVIFIAFWLISHDFIYVIIKIFVM